MLKLTRLSSDTRAWRCAETSCGRDRVHAPSASVSLEETRGFSVMHVHAASTVAVCSRCHLDILFVQKVFFCWQLPRLTDRDSQLSALLTCLPKLLVKQKRREFPAMCACLQPLAESICMVETNPMKILFSSLLFLLTPTDV